eukprot:scaffold170243_cov42-Prasinocladus_malaysianus.AAC.1
MERYICQRTCSLLSHWVAGEHAIEGKSHVTTYPLSPINRVGVYVQPSSDAFGCHAWPMVE